MDYKKINKESWNKRTEVHYTSKFYDNKAFIAGAQSLNTIELDLLGDVSGLEILHLQCHFGQDSISLARLGAQVTGIDLSNAAIDKANQLAVATNTSANTTFICCDLYDAPNFLDKKFDLVFTSYGTIGWLPDINRWAAVVSHFLKPEGRFVMAEFHPVVWMYDDDFTAVTYNYANDTPIIEQLEGTYTNPESKIQGEYVTWNHGLGEVVSALLDQGIQIKAFKEFDYSPYDCMAHMQEDGPKEFRITKFGNKIPLVYAIHGVLTNSK